MKRILIVDDSTAIRNIIKTALIDRYEILEAANGQDALDKANGTNVSLFLLDVNMPVMDGITLVKTLRKISSYEKTPIIMLTTESRDDRKQEGRSAGANGWVVKPCDPEKLLSAINKMLE